MSIWGEGRSTVGRYIADTLILLASGFGLFVMSTYLVGPFQRLLAALANEPFASVTEGWLLAASHALPWGFAWIVFFMMFEVVKTDLVEVLARDEADHARARRLTRAEPARRTLNRRCRALMVQQRLTVVRRRL
jgi:hypothetical protein